MKIALFSMGMSAFLRTHWRVLVPVSLTVAIVVLVVGGGRDPNVPSPGGEDEAAADGEKLRIRWVQPLELEPGEAVLIDVLGLEPGDAPVRARVSTPADEKLEAAILHRRGDRLVVRVPRDAPTGQVKLRVFQGEGDDERKAKPRHLQLRRVPIRDVLRDALGGLALFLLGLYGMGRALQSYAGHRVREQLGRLTSGTFGAVGLGVTLGGLMQSTTSGAAVVAGLLGARMLSERAALTLLVGVQLGAAAAGVLLPLVAMRESLWIVLIGAVCIAVSADRRMRAFGNIVLGIGLLQLGLRLLQDGLGPLVADPALLPYLHHVGAEAPLGALVGASAGALLCALLQGPGPVFAATSSLAETSGLLGLADGVAILSGTALGAAAGTALVGRAFGRAGSRLALAHACLGLVMTIVILLGAPGWTAIADGLVPGDSSAVSDLGRVLHPAMASHLGTAFLVAQLVAVLAGVALCAPILRVTRRWALGQSTAAVGSGDGGLARPLAACRDAILALAEIAKTREREPAVVAERALTEARTAVEALLRDKAMPPDGARADRVALASSCLHLASATEAALHVAERALARDFAVDAADAAQLRALHALLLEGVEALLAHVDGTALLRLDDARAREIRLNALAEAAARIDADPSEPAAGRGEVAYRLWFGELAVAYEAVGNQLYRVANAVATDGP